MKIAIGISVASLVSGVIIVTLMFCLRKKNLKTHRLYGKKVLDLITLN